MSTEASTEQKSPIIEDWWEPLMPPTDLIFDLYPLKRLGIKVELNLLKT
jgi:hypothetical protein